MIHPTMETEVISSSDILFRGLWKNQHETIVDIRVTDTDANAYKHQIPMTNSENKRRRRGRTTSALVWNNVGHSYHSWFPPDGLIGREAKNLLKQIALRLTAEWEQPYSVVRGYCEQPIFASEEASPMA
jgi:hypothetical protein